jgi:aryl-alcohol dehydrogenase-like predicted oxidoreductase
MTEMKKRRLGRTGPELSVVGFGGIIVRDEKPSSASRIVSQAVERGINYFDVAPSYGNAEERLGPALKPYRDSVFLACKTGQRTKGKAEVELRKSLRLLQTDHFDLYQLHGVTTIEEVSQIMGSGGAIEAFVKAREQGLAKYLGFSAHSEEAAVALMEQFKFDSVLFPLNWVCWHQGNFGPRVIKKAQEKGVALLALKSLAKTKGKEQKWPKCWYKPLDTQEEVSLALRFTLSLPVTAAVSPSHAELLWMACDAAAKFKPLSKKETAILAEKSKGIEPIFGQKC